MCIVNSQTQKGKDNSKDAKSHFVNKVGSHIYVWEAWFDGKRVFWV